jgi:hypothetical protein
MRFLAGRGTFLSNEAASSFGAHPQSRKLIPEMYSTMKSCLAACDSDAEIEVPAFDFAEARIRLGGQ